LAQPKRENGGKAAQRRLWRMQQAAFEDAARLAAPAGAGNPPAATVLHGSSQHPGCHSPARQGKYNLPPSGEKAKSPYQRKTTVPLRGKI